MDKTQYYIPCIKVKDLIKSDYNLNFSAEEEQKTLISTLISPLIYQIKRITGNNSSFLKEIVQVEAKHDKKKQKEYTKLLKDGFTYNGIKYLRFGKSASQAKQGITVFVADYVYEELMKISMLDIDMEGKEVVISKYEAQRCLIFSTCVLLDIPMPNIVIVDEYEKIIPNQNIKYAEQVECTSQEGNKYKVRKINEGLKNIKISPFDGCGIHSESLGWSAKEEIGLDYRPVGLQVRLPFMKGYSVEFNFKQWFKEHGIEEIVDVVGKKHKVEDIDCIWNTSMFKGFGLFKEKYGDEAINEYFKVLDKYKFKFGISKYSHHTDHINIMARMNFQYLQCLDLINPNYVEHYRNLWNHKNDNYNILDEKNDGKMIKLAKYSTNLFSNIAGGSKFHMLKFLGATDGSEFEFLNNYLKAVHINETMLEDPCIKKMIIKKCKKLIEEMKMGKIYCRGFYHTVVGDIIGYLEYISGLEPVGVLKEKEFYTKTIFKDHEDILSFRSPLVCPSEVNKVISRTGEEYEKWFGHFENQDVVMINMYDLSMPVQGGMDADGDAVFLSDEPLLVENKINKTMVIDIDDKITAKKLPYNLDNIIDYELKSRDSRIGEITNIATCILNKYTEDENLKQIYADDVSLLRLYQGKEIDSIKTGVRWNITKRLRNNLKKLPYFLLYNYEPKLKKYHTIQKKNKDLPENERIEKNAFSTPSQMNELCDYINRWEKHKLLWNKSNIDTGLLLLDYDMKEYDSYILKQFAKINRQFEVEWKNILKEKDNDDSIDLHKCLNKYKSLVLGFMDDERILANHFIKVSYKSLYTNKILCWYIFGNIMIENLIKNTPNNVCKRYIETKDIYNYDYEYLGKYYREEVL